MLKSTEFGFGGAAFVIAAFGLLYSWILLGRGSADDLTLLAVYGTVATVLVGIGVYWLVRAQRFHSTELAEARGLLPSP